MKSEFQEFVDPDNDLETHHMATDD
jgi:hypothetical protein